MSEAEAAQQQQEEYIDITGDGKLKKHIIREGTGEQAKTGDKCSVHYVGTLESDGSKFDSSRDRNEPFEFTIGQGVIQGWSLGVATMKVGELSKFIIHSDLGYGASGSPPKIPGGATLVFEIELLEIVHEKTNEEAIAEANKLSDEAGTKFRAGDFKEAGKLYHDAMHELRGKWGEEITKVQTKLNCNMALVHAKLGEWGECLHHAEDALREDENNLKALLRKLEAQINLDRLDEAKETLKKGLEASKNDKVFVAMGERIKKAEKELEKVQDNLFAKMVGKK